MERYPAIDRHEQYASNAADTFGVLVETVLGATVHLGVLSEGYRAPETVTPIDKEPLMPQESPHAVVTAHELIGNDPVDTHEALHRALSREAYDLAA